MEGPMLGNSKSVGEVQEFPHHRKWLQNSLAPALGHPSSDDASSIVTLHPMTVVVVMIVWVQHFDVKK